MNATVQRGFRNRLYQLSNLVVIPLALLVRSVMLACLCLYCFVWRWQHTWVSVSGEGCCQSAWNAVPAVRVSKDNVRC